MGKISEKGGDLPKLDRSRDVAERVNTIQCIFFPGSSGRKTDSEFPKTF